MLEYNSLMAIDELINRLETNLPELTTNPEVNKVIEERKEKIKKLKELQKIAKEEEKKERERLEKLQQENDLMDEAINNLKTLIKKKTYQPKRKQTNTIEYQSYGSESTTSESRNYGCESTYSNYGSESASSESRW